MAVRHRNLGFAALVIALAGCSSSSSPSDGGIEDAATEAATSLDAAAEGSTTFDGGADASTALDGGRDSEAEAAAAACTFATRGYPNATPSTARPLASELERNGNVGSCSASIQTFTTANAYDAYLASRTDGGIGAPPPDAGAGVNWSTEVVVVVPVTTHVNVSQFARSGDTFVFLGMMGCQGAAPQCELKHFAVPTVTGAVLEVCPYPGECMAP